MTDKSDTSKTRLRLQPADSFDLIRLLARSQHDPRKAVCELVQNSLDAGATKVSITWFTDRKARALKIVDDGVGIFPDLLRPDALRRIATTIGHSHKQRLTPAQRQEMMALGKYGIGLLGFWAVGEQMQIRSRVDDSETWLLNLIEDSPDARVERLRARRLDELPHYTEVTIHRIHEQVLRQLRPPRLQAYLASELRGQLLGREVEILIHDRVARGRAVKKFSVVAERFLGRPLSEFAILPVPGFEDARVELYYVSPEDKRSGRVALACGGSTVLDDIAVVEGITQAREPWNSGQFEGVVDFPQLDVAPGTRRDFRHDAAAAAFLTALGSLEQQLQQVLAGEAQRQLEELDRSLAKRIKQVFRKIPRLLPEYDLFDVRDTTASHQGAASTDAGVTNDPAESAALPVDPDSVDPDSAKAGEFLFPPGPLDQLALTPAKSRIPPGTTRTLIARARDASGRPAEGTIEFSWQLDGPGELQENDERAVYTAPAHPSSASVTVTATQDDIHREARATLTVADASDANRSDQGIPEPRPRHAPTEPWRSQLRDGHWEYNTGHRDYVASTATEPRRLRYLVHLFAKEIVLRNFGQPADGIVLERMVEILTYLQEAPSAPAPKPHPSAQTRPPRTDPATQS